MSHFSPNLGLGIGWRSELARPIQRRADLGFVELLAENHFFTDTLPRPLFELHERGVHLIPHGVGLSLGSAEPIDRRRVELLANLAKRVQAPLVSEHIAFVRAGGVETGHLLPLPRTREMLDILVENVQQVEAILPVPLALENISTLFDWPGAEMDEAEFLTRLCDRTEALLLLDIENIYANARNMGGDPVAFLEKLPLGRIAYVHIAGGLEQNGVYHDTHTAAIPEGVFALLEELCARVAVPGVMLERDGRFPDEAELNVELDSIAEAMQRGQARRISHEYAHAV